jgi:hypothetical protein
MFFHIDSKIGSLSLQAQKISKDYYIQYQQCTLEGRTREEIYVEIVRIPYFEARLLVECKEDNVVAAG